MALKNLDKMKSSYQSSNNPIQTDFMDNFVKMPNEGILEVRILPPASGDIFDMFCATKLHNINDKRNWHCPQELNMDNFRFQGSCSICDYIRPLWKMSEKANSKEETIRLQQEYRRLKGIKRFYFNAIVINQKGKFKDDKPNPINTPLILSVGEQIFDIVMLAIFGNEEQMEAALGDVTDEHTGRNLKIVKNAEHGSEFADYKSSKFLEPSSLGKPDQIKDWMSKLHNLKSLRQPKTMAELQLELNNYLNNSGGNNQVQKPQPQMRSNQFAKKVSVPTNLDDESIPDEDFLSKF